MFDLKQNLFWNMDRNNILLSQFHLGAFHLWWGLGGLDIHNLTFVNDKPKKERGCFRFTYSSKRHAQLHISKKLHMI